MPHDSALVSAVHGPTVRLAANAAIIAFTGPLDDLAAESFGPSLATALKAHPSVVIADLSRAELATESVRPLTLLHHLVTQAGPRFAVAGPSGKAREVLAQVRVTPAVQFYPAVLTRPPWSGTGVAAYV